MNLIGYPESKSDTVSGDIDSMKTQFSNVKVKTNNPNGYPNN